MPTFIEKVLDGFEELSPDEMTEVNNKNHQNHQDAMDVVALIKSRTILVRTANPC